MLNTVVGAGAVGAASRYGSGSDQKMRLRLRNTDEETTCAMITWYRYSLAKVEWSNNPKSKIYISLCKISCAVKILPRRRNVLFDLAEKYCEELATLVG
jgi:hypothetical protein